MAYTVHSRMKKPTARISTRYLPMLHSRWLCECMACTTVRGNRHDLISAGLKQPAPARHGGRKAKRGAHGFEAGDRQQELFVVVDAPMAGAAREQHSVRGDFHSALYRRCRQGADSRLYAFRQ